MISWIEKHNNLSKIITIIIAMIIFYVSSLTFSSGSQGFDWKPFAYHFYAFFCFSAFLLISTTRGKNRKYIFPTIIFAIIYAISDEVHQLFVPGRCFAISDILTDSMGILCATLIYLGLRYNEFKNKNFSIQNQDIKDIKQELYY